jgi:hypothetical protein
VQVASQRLSSLKTDMVALAILAHGNDYLPGIPYMSLEGVGSKPGLWDLYLTLRSRSEWKDRYVSCE